ncbi:GyrI-like domain-containing protein [Aeromicrobium stalagmiti]|uniref:GyrI-like domain-containing protein n=1 Tax=Aeromicrobium stalagmiti TaxID=2738988 RepID=UPI00156A2024|nr:GyrI-like domain-containing protein [Aeromicrobium stalagmiti]NRQ49965.1 GyrI-like domain-containing protein [Aeromicrobium stalagmiti]
MDTTEPELVTTNAQPMIEIRESLPMDQITAFFDRAYSRLGEYVAARHVAVSGPPYGISHCVQGETIDVSAALPVAEQVSGEAEIRPVVLPAGRAATLTLTGSYDDIAPAYETLLGWITAHGHRPAELAWEQYLTMPEPGGDQQGNVTQLFWLLED